MEASCSGGTSARIQTPAPSMATAWLRHDLGRVSSSHNSGRVSLPLPLWNVLTVLRRDFFSFLYFVLVRGAVVFWREAEEGRELGIWGLVN
ncbi:hypothetical protein LR48_Vigan02g150200 [Vigna angularis]|uniref:Uncharacterized protein n=2 Tax=Phaseolus angularis TaxID=3914 RepID=A0A0L9TY62_PHAAN|nr:hypothetical protein LR48_Vigan02g150200 [Vigna angularis]BAT95247.1 hypothetical protein VIGAN_08193000 [Vigna angularis var. angularis]